MGEGVLREAQGRAQIAREFVVRFTGAGVAAERAQTAEGRSLLLRTRLVYG